MIPRNVLDYIYDYVALDNSDYEELNNNFVDEQFTRLRQIAHLGLISKIHKLARHDKLEHAYGTYWLCKQCTQHTHGLVSNKKAFHLAGILHGIGHLPFSYDTEYAIAKLYHIHSPTKKWTDSVLQCCVDFLNRPSIEMIARTMKSSMNLALLYRWFTVFKLANSDKFNSDLGKQIAGIILDHTLIEHQLLFELDKLDCVLRDMHYLALGKIELNFIPLLRQYEKSQSGGLVVPHFLKFIDAAHECLSDRIYFGDYEKCLASLLEKPIVREVIENHFNASSLLNMTDGELEEALGRFATGVIILNDAEKKITDGKISRVGFYSCDLGDKLPVQAEADIAGTNMSGIHKYYQNKGISIQCHLNYIKEQEEIQWTTTSGAISITCDLEKANPQNVISALSKVEKWFPEERYSTQQSARNKAMEYILGYEIIPDFNRYSKDLYNTLKKAIPPGEVKSELFNESWKLRDWAVIEVMLFERDDTDWLIRHLLEFPEHWSTEIINSAINKVQPSRLRPLRAESSDDYKQRKERMLEYLNYLKMVLKLRLDNIYGWILPSMRIIKDDGEVYAEVDIAALYVRRLYDSPVNLDLIEVSYNNTEENKHEQRRKFVKINQLVKTRFGRKVSVKGYFNNTQIFP